MRRLTSPTFCAKCAEVSGVTLEDDSGSQETADDCRKLLSLSFLKLGNRHPPTP
jgi:hypothetical protein